MRRTITFISVFALMISMLALPATAETVNSLGDPTYTEVWDGRGSDSERCELARDPEGWIHWVFSTKGTSTDARLTIGDDVYEPGEPLNAEVWHFYTPYFEGVEDGTLEATIELFGGTKGPGGGLVISDFCPGDDEPFVPDALLNVEKTADTSYNRIHDWSIDKTVETENELEHDDLPKIWLYTDGSGDERATWNVDVTYEGYEDTDVKVSGTIEISLGGNLDAYIEDVEDIIFQGEDPEEGEDDTRTQTPVDVECALDVELEEGEDPVLIGFPYLLTQGAPDIVCTYEAEDLEVEDGVNVATVTGEFRLPEGTELEEFDPANYPIDEPAEADVIFGEPEEQTHKSVDVKDLSDLFGDVTLGTLDADDFPIEEEGKDPTNTVRFSYYKDFAFADYAACGHFEYDNTASVLGDEDEVLDSDDATLAVNVQCFVPKGETATGAGLEWRLTRRAPNTWFEYTRWTDIADDGADIITGATQGRLVIGEITGERNVTTSLSFELFTGWELDEVDGAVKVNPMSCTTNQNYVQPGQFKYQFDTFEEAEAFAFENTDCYGIHLDVLDLNTLIPDPDFGP
jgi:hypothetical protein